MLDVVEKCGVIGVNEAKLDVAKAVEFVIMSQDEDPVFRSQANATETFGRVDERVPLCECGRVGGIILEMYCLVQRQGHIFEAINRKVEWIIAADITEFLLDVDDWAEMSTRFNAVFCRVMLTSALCNWQCFVQAPEYDAEVGE